MDWSYIAGYFDGEGTAYCYPGGPKGRRHPRVGLVWANTHLASLEAMQQWIGCGSIRRKAPSKYPGALASWTFVIWARDDVLRVGRAMRPFLIIKADAVDRLLVVAESIKPMSRGRGRLAAAGAAQIRRLYWQDGLSMAQIAERFDVTWTALRYFMRQHAIEPRTRSEANRGRTYTAERNARVAAAKRRHWQDPNYREKVLAAMRLDRSKRTASPDAQPDSLSSKFVLGASIQ